MQPREFFDRVSDHEDLAWVGCKSAQDQTSAQVLVRCKSTGAVFSLAVTTVIEHPWKQIFGVLTGQRSPRIMTHITRIVGYYSQLHNWNKSKLAELKDRQRGHYILPEVKAKGDGNGEGACTQRSSYEAAGEAIRL